MQTRYISMFLNDKDELVMSHFSNADNPFDVERSLKELNGLGFEEAARQIGGVVLLNMANWYPEQMAKFQDLKLPYDEAEDIHIIHALISKSRNRKTKVHLATIEALMADVLREKPEMATDPFFATWSGYRQRSEKNWSD